MDSMEQQAAAKPSEGAVLILAGAGSGKTRTIVSRIRNTISGGLCSAGECLVMTFSTRAAQEIKERCGDSRITAGTFHSVALSILTEYSSISGNHKACRPIGETERENLISMLFSGMKKSFLGIPLDCVTSIMSLDEKHRSLILTKIPEELVAPFTELKEKFDMIKHDRNLIDYDDMISTASDIIDTNEQVRRAIRSRFRYIFVDEYQDISEDLFRFVTRIAGTNGNICATGDDAQSIYGFRSADIGYIVRFRKYFPFATTYMLTRNFRSKKEIVDLASLCIAHNRFRIRKKIVSSAGKGGSIFTHPYQSDSDQYRRVIEIIRDEIINGSSIAVLFRNNYQGELLRKFIRDSEKTDGFDTIEFITIHGAKGLEYDTVLILGIEDGIFPSDLSDIEEERRLFYVAITRAKKNLHLMYYSNGKETARFARETFLSTGWTARRYFAETRALLAGIKTSSKRIIHDRNRS